MKFTITIFLTTLFASINTVSADENSDIISSKLSGSGEDVVLIPGLMSDSRVWQDTAKALEKNYRVHQLSIAGFGGQPYKPALRQHFIQPVVDAVSNYINQQTSGNAAVVGHSLGGFVGYKLALTDTPNVSCVISVDGVPFFSSLVMMNPSLTAEQAEPQAKQLLSSYQQMSTSAMAQQTKAGMAQQTASTAGQETIMAMAKASDPKTVGRAMYELMTTDLRAQLNQLSIPVLQMAATGAIPADYRSSAIQYYQNQVSGSDLVTLVEFDQAHHFIMWDQTQAFIKQTTDFIEERCHAQ